MISCHAVVGIGEVRPGDDLAALLLDATDLRDGDVLVVTSKVVSKAEGRVVTGAKQQALADETDRVVARRGGTSIVRTRHGLVMAAAGIDASNTEPGTLVLLPLDPDASARGLREAVAARAGANVAVLVSDTSGRAWRNGQTDIAVGAAGLDVLDDHAGRVDDYGNLLAVTAPALADEVTAAADLVTGKLSRSPAAVLRGLDRLVLPPGEHGPGAAALVRPQEHDMFGLGSREAVMHALVREDRRGFGAPSSAEDLAAALSRAVPAAGVSVSPGGVRLEVRLGDLGDERKAGAAEERAETVAFAHGWGRAGDEARDGMLSFVPVTP
ncbi:MAG TPA: coenzyme F420-0:L-glutamate ligase [Nocardioidaceae bacterium]|nr:coenzyme F420-0:L-glutamate ligase [Nocardioidaceae bacterium]